MTASRSVATVAVFSAMIVSSNFALAGLVDVKLLDTLVFLCSFAFGLRVGIATAVLSETLWSFVSPWGLAGAITPFLVGGEVLFAVAGWGVARVWGRSVKLGSTYPFLIGAVLAICAFAWDLETNAATAIIAFWPNLTLTNLLATVLLGAPFSFAHMASDWAFGAVLIPLVAPLILRRARPVA